MKKTPVACTEDVTHMERAEICVRLQGKGAQSLGFVVFSCYTELKPPARARKSSLFHKEVSPAEMALLPSPISADSDPKKKGDCPREHLKLNWWISHEEGAGKTGQEEPAVGFPLDSCS